MEQLLEFAGRHPVLIAAAVVLLALIIFTEFRRAGSNQVGPADAVKLMNGGGIVVDVRAQDAYLGGHILGARNMPLDELQQKSGKLDKSKPVILCCDSGVTSQRARDILRKQGFEQLFNLRGGLRAWQQDNLPLEKK